MTVNPVPAEIAAAADELFDPLTMLGVNSDGIPEELTGESTEQTLARIALVSGATAAAAESANRTLDEELDLAAEPAAEVAARDHYARPWGPNLKPYDIGAHEWDTGLDAEATKQYHRDAVQPVVAVSSVVTGVAGLVWGFEQLARQLELNAADLDGNPLAEIVEIVRSVSTDYRAIMDA